MKIAVVLSGYFGTISTNDMQSGIKSHKKITNFFKEIEARLHTAVSSGLVYSIISVQMRLDCCSKALKTS